MNGTLAAAASAKVEERVEFLNDQRLPAVITAAAGESLTDLMTEQRDGLADLRRKYGAILFRGFDLKTPEEFRAAAAVSFAGGLKDYVGGVSPRGQVTSGVYESTRFPSHLRIPQHSEMAYLPDPPRELAFFCEIEPGTQGETPLADSRAIYNAMPPEIRERLEANGVSYHRYLFGPKWNKHHFYRNKLLKLHTSWMAAFGTEDRSVVERSCAETGSTVTFDREQGAKINNVLPAFRKHPETGENLWFNQITTFLSAPKSTGFWRWVGYHVVYPNPYRRPFHATYGDGKSLSLKELTAINDAVDGATVRFRWKRGDLLMLDNFLVTHGRMPYTGSRRILVAIH